VQIDGRPICADPHTDFIPAPIAVRVLPGKHLCRVQRLMDVANEVKEPCESDCPLLRWRLAAQDALVLCYRSEDVYRCRWFGFN
jgi:hypothetical protein